MFFDLYTSTGNPYINDATACYANECMFAWIGAYPGIKVRKFYFIKV